MCFDKVPEPEVAKAWMEETMLKEKGIKPNVDYPIGPLYSMMGFDTDMFTPMFAMARITGWTSHVMEQRSTCYGATLDK